MKLILPLIALMACSTVARADDGYIFADSFELSPDVCTASSADLAGFTRMCEGAIEYTLGPPDYHGPFTRYEQIEGVWPGDPAYLGHAAIFYLGKNQFASFAFRPGTSAAVKWSANISFGAGGWISVSNSPGQFVNALCGQAGNASNNLIFSNNGYAGSDLGCKNLNPDQIYYLNFVDATVFGTPVCHAPTMACAIAYTPLVVN